MSEDLLPGFKCVMKYNISVRQTEILSYLIKKENSTIKEIANSMQGTSESSIQNNMLKLKLKNLVCSKPSNKFGTLVYSINKKKLN